MHCAEGIEALVAMADWKQLQHSDRDVLLASSTDPAHWPHLLLLLPLLTMTDSADAVLLKD